MASIENSLKHEAEEGGAPGGANPLGEPQVEGRARRHPSSDIATQCSLRSGIPPSQVGRTLRVSR